MNEGSNKKMEDDARKVRQTVPSFGGLTFFCLLQVVFVSSDDDEQGMRKYMTEAHGDWLVGTLTHKNKLHAQKQSTHKVLK